MILAALPLTLLTCEHAEPSNDGDDDYCPSGGEDMDEDNVEDSLSSDQVDDASDNEIVADFVLAPEGMAERWPVDNNVQVF